MNSTTVKNWIDVSPMTGIYLVKNIRFERDGKPISLKALQITWQYLNELADTESYDNENDTLLAYYRMQAFLYFDCKFDFERVRDTELAEHLLTVNNLLADSQPLDYAFDLGCDLPYTTDELVKFLHPSTWLAVIPDGFELAMTYVDKAKSDELAEQAIFEYLMQTLPVNVYSKAHYLARSTIANPNELGDLIDCGVPTTTAEEFKTFVVNNSFSLPMSFLYDEYNR